MEQDGGMQRQTSKDHTEENISSVQVRAHRYRKKVEVRAGGTRTSLVPFIGMLAVT